MSVVPPFSRPSESFMTFGSWVCCVFLSFFIRLQYSFVLFCPFNSRIFDQTNFILLFLCFIVSSVIWLWVCVIRLVRLALFSGGLCSDSCATRSSRCLVRAFRPWASPLCSELELFLFEENILFFLKWLSAFWIVLTRVKVAFSTERSLLRAPRLLFHFCKPVWS